MQMTINPLNFLIKETESGFLYKQMSYVFLHGKRLKSPCTLCVAAAYCCGAVALLALLLPSLGVSSLDLGRFFIRSGPFFLGLCFQLSARTLAKRKRIRTFRCAHDRSSKIVRERVAPIPPRPGTGRDRRTGSWSPAHRRGCRSRSPLAQSAGRARAAAHPCRSRG